MNWKGSSGARFVNVPRMGLIILVTIGDGYGRVIVCSSRMNRDTKAR